MLTPCSSCAEAAANKMGINLAILRQIRIEARLNPSTPSISETSGNCGLTCGQGTTAAGLVDQPPPWIQSPSPLLLLLLVKQLQVIFYLNMLQEI